MYIQEALNNGVEVDLQLLPFLLNRGLAASLHSLLGRHVLDVFVTETLTLVLTGVDTSILQVLVEDVSSVWFDTTLVLVACEGILNSTI